MGADVLDRPVTAAPGARPRPSPEPPPNVATAPPPSAPAAPAPAGGVRDDTSSVAA